MLHLKRRRGPVGDFAKHLFRLRVKKVLHKLGIVNLGGQLERFEDHAEVVGVSHLTKEQIIVLEYFRPLCDDPPSASTLIHPKIPIQMIYLLIQSPSHGGRGGS